MPYSARKEGQLRNDRTSFEMENRQLGNVQRWVCIVDLPGAYARAEWARVGEGSTAKCIKMDKVLRWMRRKSMQEAKGRLREDGHRAVWLSVAA
jgi:hypothetical protein